VDVIAPLLVVLALGIVVLIVAAPLRANRVRHAADPDEARRADLEAAKEDKYREIRDAEMDFRTGKLSEADWRALDRELRAEAVELLRRVDELGPPA
jgi:flagellar biosynthesis/type III secretory pathway M-ring protein FliF/YscJ